LEKIIVIGGKVLKRTLAKMAALVAFSLFLTVTLGGQKAAAADINILDYFLLGKVGDSWTYAYIAPLGTPDFTTTFSQVTSGPFTGKYRIGDYVRPDGRIDFNIFERNTSGIIVYAGTGEFFSPPVIIPAILPLDEMFANYSPSPDHKRYLQKLTSSLTLPAGTFDDVVLDIDLFTRYAPNKANAYFGLDPIKVPYAVGHVTWCAAGVGTIQEASIDCATGNLNYAFQLKATTVPLPGAVWLLGSGILGLAGWRRFGTR
jgi:hypothetical protein